MDRDHAQSSGGDCRSAEENGLQRAPAPELINSFPYAMPPPVPMPRPAVGCSRAQPWLDVKRVRDGTGVGEISEAAWWIPTEEDAVAALAAARVGAHRKHHQHPCPSPYTGNLEHLAQSPCASCVDISMCAEPVPDVPPLRVGRKRTRAGAAAPTPVAKAAKPKGPPVKMELTQLPAGVPEEVPICCNGRSAVLHVRQQKVEYEGELMPPSRFEQVCGKGDAKKWKATLFHYDAATEEPTVCMQVCVGLRPASARMQTVLGLVGHNINCRSRGGRCQILSIWLPCVLCLDADGGDR